MGGVSHSLSVLSAKNSHQNEAECKNPCITFFVILKISLLRSILVATVIVYEVLIFIQALACTHILARFFLLFKDIQCPFFNCFLTLFL